MRHTPSAFTAALIAAAFILNSSTTIAADGGEHIAYGKGRTLATCDAKDIPESSGLAASRLADGVFWTHNDAGNAPRIFALNTKGEHIATCRILGAQSLDWEDIASFKMNGTSYLLIGDVGDNEKRREEHTLYIVEEPRLSPAKGFQTITPRLAGAIRFSYEDGPHNCESLAIDPTTRTIFLTEKTPAMRCGIYTLALPKKLGSRKATARKLAMVDVPTTTGMDISPDGLRMVIVTYGAAHEFGRTSAEETWADALKRPGRVIRVPLRSQGESICYGRDGLSLYLTSERLPFPLIEVKPKKEESTTKSTKNTKTM